MAEKIIHCSNPRCLNEIASVVEIEGHEMLVSGGLILKKIYGACTRCGTIFYWNITDKMLEKILKDMQKN